MFQSTARSMHQLTVTMSKHQCLSSTETLPKQNKQTIHSKQTRLSQNGQSTCLIPAPARCSVLAFWRLTLSSSFSVSAKAPLLRFSGDHWKSRRQRHGSGKEMIKACISYGFEWMFAVGRSEYADISLQTHTKHSSLLASINLVLLQSLHCDMRPIKMYLQDVMSKNFKTSKLTY